MKINIDWLLTVIWLVVALAFIAQLVKLVKV